MLATCKLHAAGIVHGELVDGHHFVPMGLSIRIVDFSTAERHECSNGLPLVSSRDRQDDGCLELVEMEETYGRIDAGAMIRSEYTTSLRSKHSFESSHYTPSGW